MTTRSTFGPSTLPPGGVCTQALLALRILQRKEDFCCEMKKAEEPVALLPLGGGPNGLALQRGWFAGGLIV